MHNYIVLHELGHAIGFYHEHNRPDRDNYIDVIYDNIESDFKYAFYKAEEGQSSTLGFRYNLQSIMHYSRGAFSKNGSDTIRLKNGTATSFGTARQLSPLDIAKANKFYNCGKELASYSLYLPTLLKI